MWAVKGGDGTLNYNQDVKLNRDSVHNRIGLLDTAREIQCSVNNFPVTLLNGPIDNNWSSAAETREFGQTEWTRLWANKFFPLAPPPEISNEGRNHVREQSLPSNSVRVRHQDHQDWNLSRSHSHRPQEEETLTSRIVRLSCWESGSNKNVDPLKRFNEVKIRRARSTQVHKNNRSMKFSGPRNSAGGFGYHDGRPMFKKGHETIRNVRIRRSPPPTISIGTVKQKINTETEQNKWGKRLQQRKMRFEQNLKFTPRPNADNMTLDQVIAKNSTLKKSPPKPQENESFQNDQCNNNERRSFNPKITQTQADKGRVAVDHKFDFISSQGPGRHIIIDGSSVGFEYGEQMYFDWEGIHVCVKYFTDYGCNSKNITVVVPEDKLRRGMSKNEDFAEELKQNGNLLTCWENSDYNQLVMKKVSMKNAVLISNDIWKKPKKTNSVFQKLIERVFRFNFNKALKIIKFSKTPFAPNGPKLEELLCVKS